MRAAIASLGALTGIAVTLSVYAILSMPSPQPKVAPVRLGLGPDEYARQEFLTAAQSDPLDPTIVDDLRSKDIVHGNSAVVVLHAKVGTGIGEERLVLRVRLKKSPWQVMGIKKISETKTR